MKSTPMEKIFSVVFTRKDELLSSRPLRLVSRTHDDPVGASIFTIFSYIIKFDHYFSFIRKFSEKYSLKGSSSEEY